MKDAGLGNWLMFNAKARELWRLFDGFKIGVSIILGCQNLSKAPILALIRLAPSKSSLTQRLTRTFAKATHRI